jgi:hypothetical protein
LQYEEGGVGVKPRWDSFDATLSDNKAISSIKDHCRSSKIALSLERKEDLMPCMAVEPEAIGLI